MPEQLPEYLLICNEHQESMRTRDPKAIEEFEADHKDCGEDDYLGLADDE